MSLKQDLLETRCVAGCFLSDCLCQLLLIMWLLQLSGQDRQLAGKAKMNQSSNQVNFSDTAPANQRISYSMWRKQTDFRSSSLLKHHTSSFGLTETSSDSTPTVSQLSIHSLQAALCARITGSLVFCGVLLSECQCP